MPGMIAIVHESRPAALRLAAALADQPVAVTTYLTAEEALSHWASGTRGCVVASAGLGGTGVRGLLQAVCERGLPVRVIVITPSGDVTAAAGLLRAGASDVVEASAPPRRLRAAVREALAVPNSTPPTTQGPLQ